MVTRPGAVRPWMAAAAAAVVVACGAAAGPAPDQGAPATRSCASAANGPVVYVVDSQRVRLADLGALRWARATVELRFAAPAAIKTGVTDLDRAFCSRLLTAPSAVGPATAAALSGLTSAELGSADGEQRAARAIRDRVEGALAGERLLAVALRGLVVE